MVNGILKFKEFFSGFNDSYVLIGGVACDILISEVGFKFRVTKDFDIILIVDTKNKEFFKGFKGFIKQGKYDKEETDKKVYYRFSKPENPDFPHQIEIFSRNMEMFKGKDDFRIIPVADISSLSAIVMDNDYYNFTLNNSLIKDDLRIASLETLILLKAKAFLDMRERKIKGEKLDSKNIKKHRSDIIRLSILLSEERSVQIPEVLKEDIHRFVEYMENEQIDYKSILKYMGAPIITLDKIINRIKSVFDIK